MTSLSDDLKDLVNEIKEEESIANSAGNNLHANGLAQARILLEQCIKKHGMSIGLTLDNEIISVVDNAIGNSTSKKRLDELLDSADWVCFDGALTDKFELNDESGILTFTFEESEYVIEMREECLLYATFIDETNTFKSVESQQLCRNVDVQFL